MMPFTAESLIADTFEHVYRETGDERCIRGAEEAALRYIEGKLTVESLPDFIAGVVAGIRRSQ